MSDLLPRPLCPSSPLDDPSQRRRTPRTALLVLAAVVAAAVLSIATVATVAAQTTESTTDDTAASDPTVTLVSNRQQTQSGSGCWWLHDHAQSFTTGTHPTGYTLRGVSLSIRNDRRHSATGAASIWTSNGAGVPSTRLGSLSNPPDFNAGWRKWTSSGIDLSPSTEYVIVLDVSSSQRGADGACFHYTNSGDEDALESPTGWKIGNSRTRRANLQGTQEWSTERGPLKIIVDGVHKDIAGTVTLSGTPSLDQPLTASLSDPDGGVRGTAWQWSKAETPQGPFTDIVGATAADYTPVSGNRGLHLRATATYADARRSNRQAHAVTAAVGTRMLVSNRHQSDDSLAMHLQAFTTGSNRTGYGLIGVALRLEPAGDEAAVREPVVRLLSDTTDNATVDPANVVATLASPTALGPAGWYTLAAPAKTPLDPTTTYYLEVSSTHASGQIAADTISSVGQDAGAAPGWTLGDRHSRATATNPWGAVAAGKLMVEFHGFVGAPQHTAPSFTSGATTTLSIADDAEPGAQMGTLLVNDADGDTAFTYAVEATSTDAASLADLAAFNRDFVLNASTGGVTVAADGEIDFHAKSSYAVKVTVSDGEDATGSAEATSTADATLTLTIRIQPRDVLALHLQEFSTGGNATGYKLNGVRLSLATVSGETAVREPVVRLLSDATDNSTVDPVDVVATFANPTALGAAGWYAFEAPVDTLLDPDSTYYLEVSSTHTSGQIAANSANIAGQDARAAAGWTLGDWFTRAAATNTWGAAPSGRLKFEFQGFAAEPAHTDPQFASGATQALSTAEDASSDAVLGTLTARDADGDTGFTYAVEATGTDAAALAALAAFNRDFVLNASTGEVSVAANARP